MKPEPPALPPRQAIAALAIERGESLTALSRLAGKNEAYLQQFVRRGTPKTLPEDVRLGLAKYLGVDERVLGARAPWTPRLHR